MCIVKKLLFARYNNMFYISIIKKLSYFLLRLLDEVS